MRAENNRKMRNFNFKNTEKVLKNGTLTGFFRWCILSTLKRKATAQNTQNERKMENEKQRIEQQATQNLRLNVGDIIESKYYKKQRV